MFRPSRRLRAQLLVDKRVQWPVLMRTAFYISACAIYFMVVLFFSESAQIRDESNTRALWMCLDVIACWAPGLMLLIPVIAYDILVFTNRFAGPMYRLRHEMQRLVDGESDRPIKIRDDDYWPEVAELFNQVRRELIQLREANSEITKTLFAAAESAEGSLADGLQQDAGEEPAGEADDPTDSASQPHSGEKSTAAADELADDADPEFDQAPLAAAT